MGHLRGGVAVRDGFGLHGLQVGPRPVHCGQVRVGGLVHEHVGAAAQRRDRARVVRVPQDDELPPRLRWAESKLWGQLAVR
jgi:hypothetical protein